jgi:DNA-binding MarR family transcriptional regulator
MDEAERNRQMQALAADLFELAGTMRKDGEEIARGAGQTQARWQVMWIAATGRLSAASIARRLGVTRQNVQRLADVLVQEGIATYEPNPDHRRSPLLILTERGNEVLEAINRHSGRRHQQTAAALGDAGVLQLRALLDDLRHALNRPHPTDDDAPIAAVRVPVDD